MTNSGFEKILQNQEGNIRALVKSNVNFIQELVVPIRISYRDAKDRLKILIHLGRKKFHCILFYCILCIAFSSSFEFLEFLYPHIGLVTK